MSTNTLHVILASVGETLFDGAATSLKVPGEAGVFEILPHHEPIVSSLTSGAVEIRLNKNEVMPFTIEGGVVEFSNNRAVVLL